MDLDSFLVSLYVQIDDWWKADHPSATRRPGRPALLSDQEVLTLAILAQWPRFRSERDFWRFAWAHLRPYFPREKGRSPVQLELWELRPYERSRCAEHGGSYPKCFGSGVPAPPGIDMVAPQALLHNALMAQF